MKTLRYARRWQLAGVLLLALVMVAALVPKLPFEELIAEFKFSDKFMHIAAFTFLAVWFAGQYEKRSYWRIAVGLIAFGILIELVQGMISYRTSEWLDLLGDVAGIAAGLIIALLGAGGWSVWVEARLGS